MSAKPAGNGTKRALARIAAGGAKKAAHRKRAKKRAAFPWMTVFIVVFSVAVALGVIVATRKETLTLKRVSATGVSGYTDDEILAMAGLEKGQDIFAISEDDVRRALSSNGLQLVSMEVTAPDLLRLTLKETKAVAAVNCAGVILVIDSEGHIIKRMTSVPEGSLVLISGMDVSVTAQGGSIESGRKWQLENMSEVLEALSDREMISGISELNVADRYNLYLVTRTGVKVVLGDHEALSDKLMWAESVLAELNQQGVRRGVLDVSTGKNAVYADR